MSPVGQPMHPQVVVGVPGNRHFLSHCLHHICQCPVSYRKSHGKPRTSVGEECQGSYALGVVTGTIYYFLQSLITHTSSQSSLSAGNLAFYFTEEIQSIRTPTDSHLPPYPPPTSMWAYLLYTLSCYQMNPPCPYRRLTPRAHLFLSIKDFTSVSHLELLMLMQTSGGFNGLQGLGWPHSLLYFIIFSFLPWIILFRTKPRYLLSYSQISL